MHTQVRFRSDPEKCPQQVTLSNGHTTARITSGGGVWDINLLCTLPGPAPDGSVAVKFRLDHIANGMFLGWGSPAIDPNAKSVYNSGSVCYFYFACPDVGKGNSAGHNKLFGLGTSTKPSGLPAPGLQVGGTLTLRYHPAHGTIHAAIDDGAPVQIYGGITQRDLVPIVSFFMQNDQVSLLQLD